MTSPIQPKSPAGNSYGNAGNWATVISGAGEGAERAMQGAASYANTKAEAKEAKRRTLANLLNQAIKRRQAQSRSGQMYQDDMNDYQSQAMQQIARGFVDAMQGMGS